MAEVTFPEDLGGDGSVVTDDANPDTGLAAGGHRLRFVPALANTVAMARTAKQQAALAKTLADQTADDRRQTSEDREAIAGAREGTAADRRQTGLDREATKTDAEATAADRQQTGEDRQATTAAAEATAAARQQTGEDRQATAAAAEATAADRQQTTHDRAATTAAAEATAADRQQTEEDRTATAADREAAQTAAASVDADKIMHAMGSGLPNEVGTAAMLSATGAVLDDAEGRPAGAPIESGSNENGSYSKYLDGSLICEAYRHAPYYDSSYTRLDTVYPMEFIDTPVVVASFEDFAGTGPFPDMNSMGLTRAYRLTKGTIRLATVCPQFTGDQFVEGNGTMIHYIAKGRWKVETDNDSTTQ